VYKVNRTNIQNTLISTGQTLELAQNVENSQNPVYKTHLTVKFTTGSEI